MIAHASWNGATDVSSWRLLSGSSSSTLTPVAAAGAGGFQTTMQGPPASYVEVQALDSAGQVIGTSPLEAG